MKYIDISKPIYSNMKGYATDPRVKIKAFKSLNKGSSCNLSIISLGTHTGTHIDAPRHIINKATTVDKISINKLICKVAVVSIDKMRVKEFCDNPKLREAKGILLKNGNSTASMDLKDACIILKNKFKLVGTEEMSIEASADKCHPVHKMLLSKGIVVVENLNLKKVKPGFYNLICLPLNIKNGDGAPARAILIDD